MAIRELPTRIFRVVRRTSVILERQDVAATMTGLLASRPINAARVRIELWGTGGLTGTVRVSGDVDGSPSVEDQLLTGPLTPSGYLVRDTTTEFQSVSGITTASLADETPLPQIAASYIGNGGEAVEANVELASELHGMIEPRGGGGRWQTEPAGSVEQQPSVLGHDDLYGFRPRVGDFYVEQRPDGAGGWEDYRIWEVTARPDYLGGLRSETVELNVEERATADIGIVTV